MVWGVVSALGGGAFSRKGWAVFGWNICDVLISFVSQCDVVGSIVPAASRLSLVFWLVEIDTPTLWSEQVTHLPPVWDIYFASGRDL